MHILTGFSRSTDLLKYLILIQNKSFRMHYLSKFNMNKLKTKSNNLILIVKNMKPI